MLADLIGPVNNYGSGHLMRGSEGRIGSRVSIIRVQVKDTATGDKNEREQQPLPSREDTGVRGGKEDRIEI